MPADVHLDLISRVRIASPCAMKWQDLDGEGSIRHCGSCRLDVYNFSQMTRREVETILHRAEGRVCAGFYRRADGTMLLRDCPVGLRAIRMKTARMVGRVAAALGLLLSGPAVLGRTGAGTDHARMRTFQPFTALWERLAPTATPPLGRLLFGKVALPPTSATPVAGPCDAAGGGS